MVESIEGLDTELEARPFMNLEIFEE